MKARRTPWWQFVIAALLGFGGGCLLAFVSERSGLSLIGTPIFVAILLAVLGIIILVLSLQVHKYATTDPKKRPHTFVNPTIAVYTLVLAKALGLAGAALAGWYLGQIVMSISHIEAAYFHDAIMQCAIAAAVCVADMIIGIVGEWLCQLPPNEGGENPKVKQANARTRVAPTAAKTSK